MAYNRDQGRGGNKRTWLMAGILVMAILLGGVYLLQRLSTNGANAEERVALIVENPQNFYGKKVNVASDIERVIGSRAFTLDAPGVAGGDLLVITQNVFQPIGGSGIEDSLYNENDRVSIGGEVREFSIRQVENELGVDLVDDAFVQWEGRPFVYADIVEPNQ